MPGPAIDDGDTTARFVGLALGEACLAPGMQDAASVRPVMDRAAVHEAGKVGADLLPLRDRFRIGGWRRPGRAWA